MTQFLINWPWQKNYVQCIALAKNFVGKLILEAEDKLLAVQICAPIFNKPKKIHYMFANVIKIQEDLK